MSRLGTTVLGLLASTSQHGGQGVMGAAMQPMQAWRGQLGGTVSYARKAGGQAASSGSEGAEGDGKKKVDRGGRHGSKLSQQDPERFARMRAIMGYYDLPTANKADEPRVTTVTINTLQTMRYLKLDPGLKKRLLNYRILNLNRDLERAFAGTRQYLKASQEKGRGAGAAGGSRGPAGSSTAALPGFLKARMGSGQ